MAEPTQQDPNRIEASLATRFFNGADLLGGGSIVVGAGGTFFTPPIRLAGMQTLVLMPQVLQAVGGTYFFHMQYLDPYTLLPLPGGTTFNEFGPLGGVAGNGLAQFPQFRLTFQETGVSYVLIFGRIRFFAINQGATLGPDFRLFCSASPSFGVF